MHTYATVGPPSLPPIPTPRVLHRLNVCDVDLFCIDTPHISDILTLDVSQEHSMIAGSPLTASSAIVSPTSEKTIDATQHVFPMMVVCLERGSSAVDVHTKNGTTLHRAFKAMECQLRSSHAQSILVPDFPTGDSKLVHSWGRWCRKSNLPFDTPLVSDDGLLFMCASRCKSSLISIDTLECYPRARIVHLEGIKHNLVLSLVDMPMDDVVLYNRVVIECRFAARNIGHHALRPTLHMTCGTLNLDDTVVRSLDDDASRLVLVDTHCVASLWMDGDATRYPPDVCEANKESSSDGNMSAEHTEVEVGDIGDNASENPDLHTPPMEKRLRVHLVTRANIVDATKRDKVHTHRRHRSFPKPKRRGSSRLIGGHDYHITNRFEVRSSRSGLCSDVDRIMPKGIERALPAAISTSTIHPITGEDVTDHTRADAVKYEHYLASTGDTPYFFKYRLALIKMKL